MELGEAIRSFDILDKIELVEFSKKSIKKIGIKSGVYFLLGENRELLYIGKSVDLKQRLSQHIRGTEEQTKDHISDVRLFGFLSHKLLPPHLSSGQYERKLILKYKPKLNRETLLFNILNS